MKIGQATQVIALVCLVASGCSQEAPTGTEQAEGAPITGAVPPPTPAVDEPTPPVLAGPTEDALGAPDETPIATEVNIDRVESMMITRPDETPEALVIFVSGLVESNGWSDPRLVPLDPDEAGGTRSFSFVATSPDREMQRNASQPIEVRLEIESFPPEVETIRIISATNELTAFVGN